MMMDSKKLIKTRGMLTPRQERFLAFYLDPTSPTCFVASRSARAAGYSPNPNACRVMGSRLLRHPKIRRVIEAALAKAGVSREAIIAKLAEVVKMPWSTPMQNPDQIAALRVLGQMVGVERGQAAAPVVAAQVSINLGEEFRELVEEQDARLAAEADAPPERAGLAGKQPLCSEE